MNFRIAIIGVETKGWSRTQSAAVTVTVIYVHPTAVAFLLCHYVALNLPL